MTTCVLDAPTSGCSQQMGTACVVAALPVECLLHSAVLFIGQTLGVDQGPACLAAEHCSVIRVP